MATTDLEQLLPEGELERLAEYNRGLVLAEKNARALTKTAQTIKFGGSTANDIKTYIQNINTANNLTVTLEGTNKKAAKSYNEFTLSVREYGRVADRAAVSSAKLAASQSEKGEELAKTSIQLQKLNREQKLQAQLNNEAEGSLNKMRAELNLLRMQYDALSGKMRDSDIGHLLLNQINAMDAAVTEIEQNTGRFQRQVGKYQQGMIGVQQVFRELPALGVSLQTFFLGISNNIQQVQDDIGRLQKQGDSMGTIFKKLGASILSVNTLISVGTTLLVLFGDQLFNAEKKTKRLREEIEKHTKAILDNLAAQGKRIQTEDVYYRDDKSVTFLERQVEALKAKGATEEEILEAERQVYLRKRKLVTGELNQVNLVIHSLRESLRIRQNSYVLTNRQESLLAAYRQRLITHVRSINNVTKQEAETQVDAMLKTTNASKIALDELITKAADLKTSLAKEQSDYNNKIIANQKKLSEELKQQQEEAAKEINERGLPNTIARLNYEIALLQDQIQNTQYGTPLLQALIGRKEDLENLVKFYSNGGIIRTVLGIDENPDEVVRDFIDQQIKPILDGIQQELDKIGIAETDALQDLEDSYASGVKTFAQYEQEKTDITNKYAAERLQVEINALRKVLDNTGLTTEQRAEYEKRLKGLELELTQTTNAQKLDADKVYAKESLRIEEELINRKRELRQGLANVTVDLLNFILAKEAKDLDQKQNVINQEKEQRISYINSLAIAEEEKRDRIYNAEQQAFQRQKQIDAQKEALDKRRFRLQQLEAAANVFFKTQEAAAAVQLKAAELLATPATAALAPAALAQLPYIYLNGGLAEAAILAKIVAYKEGTKGKPHPGGLAKVGDGGEHEIVTLPNGYSFITPSTDTIMNLPKGAEVTPFSAIENQSNAALGDSVLQNIVRHYGVNNTFNSKIIVSKLEELNRSLINKPVPVTTIGSGVIKEAVYKGNSRHERIRRNILD